MMSAGYRARLLDLAAYPQSVPLGSVASAERTTDAIVHALDIISADTRSADHTEPR
jgi:hypothetical protein